MTGHHHLLANTTLLGDEFFLHIKAACRKFRKILSDEIKTSIEFNHNQIYIIDKIQNFDIHVSTTEDLEKKILPSSIKFNALSWKYGNKEQICFLGECCVSLIYSIASHSIFHFQQLVELIEYWKERESSPISAMLELGPLYWIKLAYNQFINTNAGKKVVGNLQPSKWLELLDNIRMKQRGPTRDLNELLEKLSRVESCHAFICGHLVDFLHRFQAVRTIHEISDVSIGFLNFIDGLFILETEGNVVTMMNANTPSSLTTNMTTSDFSMVGTLNSSAHTTATITTNETPSNGDTLFERHFTVHPLQEELQKQSQIIKRSFFHSGIGPIQDQQDSYTTLPMSNFPQHVLSSNRTPSPSLISGAVAFNEIPHDQTDALSYHSMMMMDRNYRSGNTMNHVYSDHGMPNQDITTEQFLQKIDQAMQRCRNWYYITNYYLKQYQKPNHFYRNWIGYTVGVTTGALVSYYAYKHVNDIVRVSTDAYQSVARFFHNSIAEPLYNIYSIIHYDEHKHKLASLEDVELSAKSLERMVLDFVKDTHPNISQSDLVQYAEQAKKGDISVVMETYEKELKSPVTNALFGSLARALLIQVQKQKLAVEQSMVSIDALMKQNELNLELIAAVPGVLLFSFLYYQITNFKRKTDYSNITEPMIRQMLLIEKILNRNIGLSRLALIDYGTIYLYASRVKFLANRFSTLIEHPRAASDFTSDLNEVNSTLMSPAQKFNTVHRMFRQYQFLNQQEQQ
ncbi:hypothetical protein FDP41_000196 [Naegleria fowleri]|uniref:Uncharacterized protein n=1 Tax=Naegleria fowleri TaxID=5763 RepID=A0A6A5C782_NAEFO|nr:uncharacterized protein FDP41_000196 [Naegleria fowleri]KAF0985157.1 hypothetical protein FDP41_000196 [Naegleria fowleri]